MVQRYVIEPSELQTSEKQHSSSEIFFKKNATFVNDMRR